MAMKAMLLLACMFVVAHAAYVPAASPTPGHSNCAPPPPPPPCNGTTPPPTTTPTTPPPTTTPTTPPTTTPSTPPPTTTPSTPPPTTTPSASPPYFPGTPTGEPVILKRCAQESIAYCNSGSPGTKRFCQKITSRCCAKYGCLPGLDKNCPEWGTVDYHGKKYNCP